MKVPCSGPIWQDDVAGEPAGGLRAIRSAEQRRPAGWCGR